MTELIRDTALGHVLRSISCGRFLPYQEERDRSLLNRYYTLNAVSDNDEDVKSEDEKSNDQASDQSNAEEGNDPNIVEWYGPDDPENPQNWSWFKKAFVTFQICWLSFTVFVGAAIYSPGLTSVEEQFSISEVAAILGLTVFVAGNGLGVMLFSPITEVPQIGRNPVYLGTLFLFMVLQVPTALSINLGMLLAFRFITGFVGAPPLAAGGASMSDMYPPPKRAYAISWWDIAALCGPCVGPLLAGFAVQAKDWRWSMWILMWLAAVSLVFHICFLPETFEANILYRRARRLRKLTGNERLKSRGEIEYAQKSLQHVAYETLVRPFTLNLEPIIFSLNLYTSLIYALLYMWLESFSLVFEDVYGMNTGLESLTFLGLLIGALIATPPLFWHIRTYIEPRFNDKGEICPEERLITAEVGAFFIPICLFIFGWTSRTSVPFIVPIIGSAFFGVASQLLYNSIFNYLPDVYPKYSASVLAGNEFMRSMFGAGFPLFAGIMYKKLGIDWASTLLALLGCVFVPVPFVLRRYGKKLREASKYARHDI